MLNEIILQGRLTNDPELKITPNGKYVTSFSVACEREFSTGNERETDFINIVAWNKSAEFINKYFTKGKQILVRGSLQVRKYQTQNGENRYATEVVAEKVYFCGDKTNATQNEIDDFVEVSETSGDLPFQEVVVMWSTKVLIISDLICFAAGIWAGYILLALMKANKEDDDVNKQ